MKPYLVEPPVEIPGFGQIHGNIIEDAVTWAEYELAELGQATRWISELERIIQSKTWRAAAAMDVLLRIQRAMVDLPTPEDAKEAV
jgi:hypothetical protein